VPDEEEELDEITEELCPECGESIDDCECDDDELDEDGSLPGEDDYDDEEGEDDDES
jgi:hypothetical protein